MRLVLGYLLKSLDVGDLDDDQKQAMAGPLLFPVMMQIQNSSRIFVVVLSQSWTRGHEGDDGSWDPDSPWSGDGGHVLYSNGKVEFYENTKGADEEGVFNVASRR